MAYVSYNTYPGWHMREMVRHMMRYHAGQFADPREQVEQARALLTFLASASADTGPYGQLLTAEVERLGRAPDSYLFHEHLERTNLPIYFHQFIERAEHAGLQYLSEAVVSEMLTSHFPRRSQRRSSASVPICCTSSSTWISSGTASSVRRCSATRRFIPCAR